VLQISDFSNLFFLGNFKDIYVDIKEKMYYEQDSKYRKSGLYWMGVFISDIGRDIGDTRAYQAFNQTLYIMKY